MEESCVKALQSGPKAETTLLPQGMLLFMQSRKYN
jgi:hypothetical protein